MGLVMIPAKSYDDNEEEKYVKEKLITLYQNTDRNVILYVKPKLEKYEPDFLLIDPQYGICIIEVKAWSMSFIKNSNNDEFTLGGSERKERNPASKVRIYHNTLNNLLKKNRLFIDNRTGKLNINIYSIVFWPNMLKKDLESINLNLQCHYPVKNYDQKKIQQLKIGDLYENNRLNMTSDKIDAVRKSIYPELKIYDNLSDSDRTSRTIKVLDAYQEDIARRIPNGYYFLSGPPGTGKTVILLARAIHLLRINPNWKIHILTYSKILSKNLSDNLDKLKDELYDNINLSNLSISTFHHEVIKTVDKTLKKMAKKDEYWKKDLPTKAIAQAQPKYDSILIDECQDFEESWIKFCMAITKVDSNGNHSMFFVGDRLQSIFKSKKINWTNLGISSERQSKLLKYSYRCGKKQLEIALKFLERDKFLKEEIKIYYKGTSDLEIHNHNSHIEFISSKNEIVALHSNLISNFNYKLEDILILVVSKEECQYLKESFNANIQTYHSSKGLEVKICILMDFDKITDRKLAYVGITRASEKLYIHSNNFHKENYAKEIKDIYYSMYRNN